MARYLTAEQRRRLTEFFDSVSFLSASDFYTIAHQQIFSSMEKLNDAGTVIDATTMSGLVGDEQGGMAYLIDLWKSNPSMSNAIAYANNVLDCSIKRTIQAEQLALSEQINDGSSDYLSLVENFNTEVNRAISRKSHGEVMTIDELIELSATEMEKSNRNIKTGLSTGIPEVDERLGDMLLAYGEITVLGGLSKNGKTLLANTITARLDLDENEVGHIFSIEMTSAAMFNSVISARTGIPANFYRKQAFYSKRYPHEFDTMHGKWGSAAKELYESKKFKFDGKKEVDADYICSEMRKQAAHAKNAGKILRYVLIDHMHRMNYHNGNSPMTYAIRDAVRKIKNTAAELGIAVLALAQLNNKAEKEDPSSFHILDSSSVRHEMQAFIGIKMYRHNGSTFFGIFADSQRYADMDTKHDPAYMMLIGGVLQSLPEHMQNWKPEIEQD